MTKMGSSPLISILIQHEIPQTQPSGLACFWGDLLANMTSRRRARCLRQGGSKGKAPVERPLSDEVNALQREVKKTDKVPQSYIQINYIHSYVHTSYLLFSPCPSLLCNIKKKNRPPSEGMCVASVATPGGFS